MTKQKKIIVASGFAKGSPHLEGTGLSVYHIVTGCRDYGIPTYRGLFEDVFFEDVCLAISYCSSLECKQEGSYCGGCSLRDAQEGVFSLEDFVGWYEKIFFEDSDEVILGRGEKGTLIVMPGTPRELSQNWRGMDTWKVAEKLLEELELPESKAEPDSELVNRVISQQVDSIGSSLDKIDEDEKKDKTK